MHTIIVSIIHDFLCFNKTAIYLLWCSHSVAMYLKATAIKHLPNSVQILFWWTRKILSVNFFYAISNSKFLLIQLIKNERQEKLIHNYYFHTSQLTQCVKDSETRTKKLRYFGYIFLQLKQSKSVITVWGPVV